MDALNSSDRNESLDFNQNNFHTPHHQLGPPVIVPDGAGISRPDPEGVGSGPEDRGRGAQVAGGGRAGAEGKTRINEDANSATKEKSTKLSKEEQGFLPWVQA